jgi:hypothetical protein
MNSGLSLRVTKGKHAGAVQDLQYMPLVIGSSLDADIVLTDEAVLTKHLRLTPGVSTAGLEPLDGEVLSEGRSIYPGGKAQVRYPLRIALGGAELEIAQKRVAGLRPAANLALLGALFAIFAAIIYSGIAGKGSSLHTLQEPAPAAATLVKLAGPDTELTKAAAEALRFHLASLNIDTVTITQGEGTVGAHGTVEAERKDDWHSLEIWFDENFGQHVVLQSNVSAAPENRPKAPIALQAVWAGKFPYIIDGEGNKHFEGSKIRDGWIVEKIEEGGTTIRKGKEALMIKY